MTDEYSDIQSAVNYLLEKCDGILSIREFIIQDLSLRDKTSYSSADINILARQMADHIGLNKSHFIIELGTINDSVSGRIHLQEWLGFTKIQIDSDLVRHPETLLMVLSHELTHKYLHEHAAEYANTNANEELTDIASVFLGFGKYILNGKHYSENSASGVHNVTVGYLTDSAFAIAYDVSCFQRGLTEDTILDGLSGGALKSLWDVRTNHREKYPKRILKLRKAQADLKYIEMTLDECTTICSKETKIARFEIDRLWQWLAHLKNQLHDVLSTTESDVLEKYVDQVTSCEDSTSHLLDSLQQRILKLHKAQADLKRIEMTLDECTTICSKDTKIECVEIDRLWQYLSHLKNQHNDVLMTTEPDVLQRHVNQLKSCEDRASLLLASLQKKHNIPSSPNGHANESVGIARRSSWFIHIIKWIRSKLSCLRVFKRRNVDGGNTSIDQDKTSGERADCNKKSVEETRSLMSKFDYQIGQSFPDKMRTRWTSNCGFGNHKYRELYNFKLKSKLFDFDRYSLLIMPSSWKIFAIELTSHYETREEADSMKNKIQAWLVKCFPDRTTDCLGVRSWWMGLEECGTYITLACSDVKWGNLASSYIRLTIRNVDATNELVEENNKLIDVKDVISNLENIREIQERRREELEDAAEGKYQIVKDITPAALWYGHIQGSGNLNYLSNEIYRVSVKLKPEIYKRIESGEFRGFRVMKKSDMGKRLALSNRRRIGAIIFVSWTDSFPREVMCWEVIEELDVGDAYSLGLGRRVM